MIDLIHVMLKTASNDRGLKSAVRVAASLGCTVLNRYYSKTDDSIMYRCAMSKSYLLRVVNTLTICHIQ